MENWLEQLQNFQNAHSGIYSAIVAAGLILAALLANWVTKRLLLRGLVRILHALPARDAAARPFPAQGIFGWQFLSVAQKSTDVLQ